MAELEKLTTGDAAEASFFKRRAAGFGPASAMTSEWGEECQEPAGKEEE